MSISDASCISTIAECNSAFLILSVSISGLITIKIDPRSLRMFALC
jgi:predicted Na+-dependent transporter